MTYPDFYNTKFWPWISLLDDVTHVTSHLGSRMRTKKVTCFVILFPIIVSFPMLMFYDTICGICMPNSQTNFQYQIFHLLKIILFMVVYLIPVLCSSRSFWIIRNSRKCSIKKKRQFHNCQSGWIHEFPYFYHHSWLMNHES